MKSKILILLFSFITVASTSQTLELKIIGKTTIETKIIDSIGYITKHKTLKQLTEEINFTSEKISKLGYIENQTINKKKENDSCYSATISLGDKIKYIHIYIGRKNNINFLNLFKTNQDTITLPYSQTETFLNKTTQNLEQNGYAFAKVKLTNIQKKNHTIFADLTIETGQKRTMNAVEIVYANQKQKIIFSEGAKKQIIKKYRNVVFNQKTIEQLYQDFEKFEFIQQTKYPEALFTKDTTKVFIYLEKRKASFFDGFLGFNNTEEKKIQLNGYLNLTLVNAIRNGETLSIYWKNDGNNQKIFDANLRIPYLFKTPIEIKGQINIFKQDSIFQNTKTGLQLGYSINHNKGFYLGFESTESSDIQNSNVQNIADFKNSFFISTIEYKISNFKKNLFPIKSYLNLTFGTGNRNSISNPPLKQSFINFNIMNDFYINEKNIINIKNHSYYLKSKTYLTNELLRFGGINSVRGFTENSLQANLMIALMSEYRYLLSPNLYFNSILDYCYYEDLTITTTTKNNQKLLGIGLGLGMQTSNGLLKFSITNGKTDKDEIKFPNTIISINYNVKF